MTDEFVITMSEPEFQIISEAPQGLAGPRGLPGNGGTARVAEAISQPIEAFRFVVRSLAGVTHADASDPLHLGRVFGMSSSFANQGEPFGVVTGDEVENPDWAWDLDLPLWLGFDGRPTQQVPVSETSWFCQQVGFPTTPQKIFIQIGTPVVLSR